MPQDNAPAFDPPDFLALDNLRLAGVVGHLLRRCQQRAVEIFVDEVGEDGPTPRQFAILLTVYQNDGINQTDLVQLSGVDRSTLTEMLKRMVDRGLLRRERAPEDLRTNVLHITDRGLEMLRRAQPAAARAQDRILAPIPEDRRGDAMAMLELLSGMHEAAAEDSDKVDA